MILLVMFFNNMGIAVIFEINMFKIVTLPIRLIMSLVVVVIGSSVFLIMSMD